jgi:iron complex transport system ATP-binding protein
MGNHLRPLLEVKELNFFWNATEALSTGLKSIQFKIYSGDIVALLGPNGSGKSTFLKIIAGVKNVQESNFSGSIYYQGEDFFKFSQYQKARSIVYVPAQMMSEFPIRVVEVIQLGRISHSFRDNLSKSERKSMASIGAQIESIMQKCQCWHLRDRFLHQLSSGERQLVAVARAFAQDARLLLLDEAVSQMDLHHQLQMGILFQELSKQGKALILVAHDMNLIAEWANRAVFFKKGQKIFDGSIHAVLTQENIQMIYPGVPLMVGVNPYTGMPKVFQK